MNSSQPTSLYVGLSSRDAFGKVIVDLASVYKDIVALTADLTASVRLAEFKKKFPDRFMNFGIAEQNMLGAAAGLTLAGKNPFVSTYAVFSSMRACEQVRTDIAYNDLPVKIVSSHSGFSFGVAGSTHHAIEDIGIFRTIPGMTVLVPSDGVETASIIRSVVDFPRPVYVRLSRAKEKTVYLHDFDFKIGKPDLLIPGKDIVLIATGAQVGESLEAARLLKEISVDAGVINISTIKPIDQKILIGMIENCSAAMTIEEHTIINGLGSAVSEIIASNNIDIKFMRHGLKDVFTTSGSYEDLLRYYHLDAKGIRDTAIDFLESAI